MSKIMIPTTQINYVATGMLLCVCLKLNLDTCASSIASHGASASSFLYGW